MITIRDKRTINVNERQKVARMFGGLDIFVTDRQTDRQTDNSLISQKEGARSGSSRPDSGGRGEPPLRRGVRAE